MNLNDIIIMIIDFSMVRTNDQMGNFRNKHLNTNKKINRFKQLNFSNYPILNKMRNIALNRTRPINMKPVFNYNKPLNQAFRNLNQAPINMLQNQGFQNAFVVTMKSKLPEKKSERRVLGRKIRKDIKQTSNKQKRAAKTKILNRVLPQEPWYIRMFSFS